MGQRLRKTKRYEILMDVRLSDGLGGLDAGTVDVSRTGMFVSCDSLLSTGATLRMETILPSDDRPIKLAARVIWISDTKIEERLEAQHGMGLELYFDNRLDKQRWEDFVESVRRGEITSQRRRLNIDARVVRVHTPQKSLKEELGQPFLGLELEFDEEKLKNPRQ